VNQFINSAIPIFELQFPGCQALFLFDNAPSYHSWPQDALRAQSMNLTPGGEVPIMRDSWYISRDGEMIIQETNYRIDDYSVNPELRGKPKCIKILMEERGLWRPNLRLKCKTLADCDHQKAGGCCACTYMSLQSDFQSQKNKLEEAALLHGHLSLLYPKYHCELNWIEHFWGAAKWHTRKYCKYTIPDLRKRIPEGLKYAECFIWRFWQRTWDIAQAYRDGVGWGAEKKYKSHRRLYISTTNGLVVS
jgi:hypothetical protein